MPCLQELPAEHRYPMRKYEAAHELLRGDGSLHKSINFQPVRPAVHSLSLRQQ
jgi:hypothetical protein